MPKAKFNPLDPELGLCAKRATPTAVAEWFVTEVVDAHFVNWIGSGSEFVELLRNVGEAFLDEFTMPEELQLPDELTYLVSHTNAALRACNFFIDWVIEPFTRPGVIDDIVSLERARRNTKGKQGILERM